MAPPSRGEGGKDDSLRFNNSASEFLGSNNLTRSNDYTRHMPPRLGKPSANDHTPNHQLPPAHIKQASDHTHFKQPPATPSKFSTMPPSPVKPVKQDLPPSPVKPHMTPPEGEVGGDEGASAITSPPHIRAAKKFPSKVPPRQQQPTTPPSAADLSPPPSSGYKSGGGSVFNFSTHSTPRASTHSNGASASSSSETGSSYQPSPVPGDPNVKLNYNAKVYLTNSERAAYGRNILARQPSVDGSKMKYIVGDRSRRTSNSSYASDSLPRATYHRRHDAVQLADSEMGCSQC